VSAKKPGLLIQSSPFIRQGLTTPRVMADVLVALVPVLAVAAWTFGVGALLVVGAATAGAAGTEWLLGRRMPGVRLADGSGAVTGVILGLTLPPGLPLWNRCRSRCTRRASARQTDRRPEHPHSSRVRFGCLPSR
jgi:electron transport complex protein RnfD